MKIVVIIKAPAHRMAGEGLQVPLREGGILFLPRGCGGYAGNCYHFGEVLCR